MRLETQLQAPVWQQLFGLKQASDSLWASVSPPLLGGVVEHLSGGSLLQRPLAPPGTVIGSSCSRVSVGIGEGASGLPQPPDTVPWFMSNCQPQSSFPPGQSRLQWASGEVACPATMFTVLRRHREPDLGRPGWAAPLGPSCVHTHFPETEHGRPLATGLAESSCPATSPWRAQLPPARHLGWLQNVPGPREPAQGQEERVQRERERDLLPPDRFMLSTPARHAYPMTC